MFEYSIFKFMFSLAVERLKCFLQCIWRHLQVCIWGWVGVVQVWQYLEITKKKKQYYCHSLFSTVISQILLIYLYNKLTLVFNLPKCQSNSCFAGCLQEEFRSQQSKYKAPEPVVASPKPEPAPPQLSPPTATSTPSSVAQPTIEQVHIYIRLWH